MISTDRPAAVQMGKGSAQDTLFPFGFMGVEGSNMAQMDTIAALGVHEIHNWDFQEYSATQQEYFRRADAARLHVIQQLPGEKNLIRDEAFWRNLIPLLAASDNLSAWYMPDEIGKYDPGLVHAAELYQWIKRFDPGSRPVYANAGTDDIGVIQRLASCADMLWYAAFPNYDRKPRVLITWAVQERLMPASRERRIPFGVIIEFFDPDAWGVPGDISTPQEIRCDVYQSLIAGSRGVWFYSWRRGRAAQGHEPALREIEKITREILGAGGLKEILKSPGKNSAKLAILSGPRRSPAVNGKRYDPVQWTQRTHSGREYLFAVNVTDQEVTASFGALPLSGSSWSVLFENRTASAHRGTLVDTFAPYAVHLYQLDQAKETGE